MQAEDEILMRIRPTRFIGLKYYVLMLVSLLLAAVTFYIGPVDNYARVSGEGMESSVDVLVARLSVDESVGIFFLFIALYGFARAEMKRRRCLYEIRDDRVVRIDGIMRKSTETIPYRQIEEIRIDQGIINRMLNTGTLTIDTGEEDIEFESVPHVKDAQNLIIQHMNRVSHYRGR